jgi:large subunit ribosomal protein L23
MEVVKRPLITEKVTAMNESGKYAFEVDRKANKIEIKKAIEKMYGVTIESVSTLRAPGKLKSKYTKAGVVSGRSGAIKKAIVTVREGEVIDFYSTI